jgi:hypothetical protein
MESSKGKLREEGMRSEENIFLKMKICMTLSTNQALKYSVLRIRSV